MTDRPVRAVRKSGRSTQMVCDRCKFELDDETADRSMGVFKVDAIDRLSGENVGGYVNFSEDDESYKLFRSLYCLKKFKTPDDVKEHDAKYHKVGDFQLQTVPSGFADQQPVCGDEMVI